jgi:hypothetical protein
MDGDDRLLHQRAGGLPAMIDGKHLGSGDGAKLARTRSAKCGSSGLCMRVIQTAGNGSSEAGAGAGAAMLCVAGCSNAGPLPMGSSVQCSANEVAQPLA